jgi:hypothetical protein
LVLLRGLSSTEQAVRIRVRNNIVILDRNVNCMFHLFVESAPPNGLITC